MKFAVWILVFLAGSVVGGTALGGYWYWKHHSTEVWVATRALQSEGGIVVPAGTELILNRWMPEGFAALELGINVEGDTLDHFHRRTEQRSFLRVPYFLHSGHE